MLHDTDDAQIRLVAQGLVKLVGTDVAAEELSRLYGRSRATEALSRTATLASVMDLQDDIEIILDLSDVEPVDIDLRDPEERASDRSTAVPPPPPYGYAEGFSAPLRQQRVLSPAGRPYWL